MGRPATGRTTKTVRVPNDFNLEVAMHLYYVVLPLMYEQLETISASPRNYNLAKFLKNVVDGMPEPLPIGGGGKTHTGL